VIFVDTSAFYARLDRDDRYHREAVATLARLAGGEVAARAARAATKGRGTSLSGGCCGLGESAGHGDGTE